MLQEIQFYVYQDLANVLGVLTDAVESIKFNKNTGLHEQYIPIALERLYSQINISNGIFFNMQQTHSNNQEYISKLKAEKKQALEYFKKIIGEQQLNSTKNDYINKCIDHYMKYNMSEKSEYRKVAEPDIKTTQTAQFNQGVVQALANSMCAVNQTMNQVSRGQYQKLSEKDILQMTKQRQSHAQNCLQEIKYQLEEEAIFQQKDKRSIQQNKSLTPNQHRNYEIEEEKEIQPQIQQEKQFEVKTTESSNWQQDQHQQPHWFNYQS